MDRDTRKRRQASGTLVVFAIGVPLLLAAYFAEKRR